jgi:hypothetical protein
MQSLVDICCGVLDCNPKFINMTILPQELVDKLYGRLKYDCTPNKRYTKVLITTTQMIYDTCKMNQDLYILGTKIADIIYNVNHDYNQIGPKNSTDEYLYDILYYTDMCCHFTQSHYDKLKNKSGIVKLLYDGYIDLYVASKLSNQNWVILNYAEYGSVGVFISKLISNNFYLGIIDIPSVLLRQTVKCANDCNLST